MVCLAALEEFPAACRVSEWWWMTGALARIDQDPLARCIPTGARAELATAARAAGEGMARDLRAREPRSAAAALRARGVTIEEVDAPARIGPFIHHAVYQAPPPRVTVFRRTLTALHFLIDSTGVGRLLRGVALHEIVLAHELCHHLVHIGRAPAAVTPRVDVLRLGSWRRRAVVRAAEEIAAAGFSAVWCGVPWAPDVLDRLTLMLEGEDP